MRKDTLGSILKIIAIVFMGLTAAMNLLGGVGTVCAAFLTENFESMAALLPYQWLYQPLMILTILTGIAGGWATIRLIGGGEKVYLNALIVLGVGTVLGAIHVIASLAIRGAAMPANMKLYINIITLVIFAVLGLPGLRERVDFEKQGPRPTRRTAGGLAAIVTGLALLSTPMWAGPSHAHAGGNWVDLLRPHLLTGGAVLMLAGIALLGVAAWASAPAQPERRAARIAE